MKHFFSLFFLSLGFSALIAQEIPKNPLIEHFTNTFCSVCASRNPAFYNTIDNAPNAVHIAFHPSSPYPTCPLNQHNMTENDARTNFYGIFGGTPRVVLNGNVIPAANPLLSAMDLELASNETTPFDIQIEQFLVGTDSMYAEIRISTVAPTPITSAGLVVAVNEKELQFAAQNGENMHYDVFRKFLENGAIGLPSNGNEITLSYGTRLDAEWNASEITTTAFLQENSNNVLQAKQSDKLNVPATSISEVINVDEAIFPNPAKNFITIDNSSGQLSRVEIYNIIGSQVASIDLNSEQSVKLNVSDFERGSYIVRISDITQKLYTRKLVLIN